MDSRDQGPAPQPCQVTHGCPRRLLLLDLVSSSCESSLSVADQHPGKPVSRRSARKAVLSSARPCGTTSSDSSLVISPTTRAPHKASVSVSVQPRRQTSSLLDLSLGKLAVSAPVRLRRPRPLVSMCGRLQRSQQLRPCLFRSTRRLVLFQRCRSRRSQHPPCLPPTAGSTSTIKPAEWSPSLAALIPTHGTPGMCRRRFALVPQEQMRVQVRAHRLPPRHRFAGGRGRLPHLDSDISVVPLHRLACFFCIN